jgi:hypothetical protein
MRHIDDSNQFNVKGCKTLHIALRIQIQMQGLYTMLTKLKCTSLLSR